MPESEQLSALIGDIYDSALDPALWMDVLAKSAAFVGGCAASIYSKDVAKKIMPDVYQWGLDDRYVELFKEKYIKFDPTALGYFIADVEQPISTADVMPFDEFRDTRFYKEWAKPQGLVDTVHAMLEKSVTSSAALVVFRDGRDGVVDDETRRRMRLVVPHFRRAVLVGKVIDLAKAEAASLADTLDGISAGMFLVDAIGRIVHANVAGHVMLNAAEVLRADGPRLSARDPQANRLLADTFAAAGNGDLAVGIKGVAAPLVARDGDRYVAHVLPLTSGARRRAGASYAAVAAMFVHKAALDTPSPPEAIAKAYGLTPTELRVLLAIVEVGGPPDVAEALGVAESTVTLFASRKSGNATHNGRSWHQTSVAAVAQYVRS